MWIITVTDTQDGSIVGQIVVDGDQPQARLERLSQKALDVGMRAMAICSISIEDMEEYLDSVAAGGPRQ